MDPSQPQCTPNGTHVWHWAVLDRKGKPVEPQPKEPLPDTQCQCGERTWANRNG